MDFWFNRIFFVFFFGLCNHGSAMRSRCVPVGSQKYSLANVIMSLVLLSVVPLMLVDQRFLTIPVANKFILFTLKSQNALTH